MTTAAPTCTDPAHPAVSVLSFPPVPTSIATRPVVATPAPADRLRGLLSLVLHIVAVLAAAVLLLLADNPLEDVTVRVDGTPHPATAPANPGDGAAGHPQDADVELGAGTPIPAVDPTAVPAGASAGTVDPARSHTAGSVTARGPVRSASAVARIGVRVSAVRAAASTGADRAAPVRPAPLHRAAR